MASALDTLFGPLGKKYCVVFWIMSAIALFIVVFSTISTVLYMAFIKKRFDLNAFGMWLYTVLIMGLQYLQTRILFNMCSGTM